jgi:hypothetical protein
VIEAGMKSRLIGFPAIRGSRFEEGSLPVIL